MSIEDEAPGWDAIDGALRRLYQTVEPLHYAASLPAIAGCYRTGLMSGSWTGWLMVIAGLISWDPALEGWSGRST